ncbi:MAG: ABC-type dipeptide/oligopeptide/nickel transport system, ATPase component [Candidatus Methanohalarchaeum thermophilum]|uniref:ABC-type dipeptide/oligopeptide/nickel transport system, ATPase component n=1 Tax=Methanohalarchaeum thermophilum TaxID=1903181 RepID=A0A1Q6DTR8_METT1|nr:MAG: ABC-type dipeptide/oligopeptide/nickel transport system, ATPase component [Candidatus Methanohalarchaeum thermophilum]
MSVNAPNDNVLELKGLKVRFDTYEGLVKALEGVNFNIKSKETFGIVGETGCGKSVTAKSIMRLISSPGKITDGEILFKRENNGVIDILELSDKEVREIRGDEISMIFQEPGEALNPVYTTGYQLKEAILSHQSNEFLKEIKNEIEREIEEEDSYIKKKLLNTQIKLIKRNIKKEDSRLTKYLSKIPLINGYKDKLSEKAKEKAINLLEDVELSEPEEIYKNYPHELSGGQKQRVIIAMALSSEPTLLTADEPTSSLDVSIQSKILSLLDELKEEHNLSILYITHNLGVVAQICDRVGVMYSGRIVEIANVNDIFENPLHPYTISLIEAIPSSEKEELNPIGGVVPNLVNPPSGCRFHPRCPRANERCKKKRPSLKELEKDHWVECYHSGDKDGELN